MGQFLTHPKKKLRKKGDDVYELRGVLVHKGSSAASGHYIAEVFNVECAQLQVLFSLTLH